MAGIDVAGEDEEDPAGEAIRVNPRRDSTVLTIAYAAQTRVEERVLEPSFEVVHQYVWRGDRHRELYPRILALVGEHWRCRSVVIDATGVGGGLAAVNGRRFLVYAESSDDATNDLRRELLRQCEAAEYAMRANQVMSFFVPEHRGHDDLLNAAALVVQAQPLGALRTATGRCRS